MTRTIVYFVELTDISHCESSKAIGLLQPATPTTFVGQKPHRERAASISGLTYMQASFASTAQREWISTCSAIYLTQRSMKSTETVTSSTWFWS